MCVIIFYVQTCDRHALEQICVNVRMQQRLQLTWRAHVRLQACMHVYFSINQSILIWMLITEVFIKFGSCICISFTTSLNSTSDVSECIMRSVRLSSKTLDCGGENASMFMKDINIGHLL